MDLPATSSTSAAGASDAVIALIRHFPPDVRDAYLRFQDRQDPADADLVIAAVVIDHMPDKNLRPAGGLGDELGLIADLGFDSIAITEMVFFVEDLFRVKISNEEILSVRTVGDLRAFVRRKLAAAKPATGA